MVSRRSCLSALPVGLASLAGLGATGVLRGGVRAMGVPGAGPAAVPGAPGARLAAAGGGRAVEAISVDRQPADPAALAAGSEAVRAFSVDLYRGLAANATSQSNLVCSPYSIAVALAMARAGAVGATAIEMDTVLHAPQPRPRALDAGLNALDQLLRSAYQVAGSTPEQVPGLATANALWSQAGLVLEPAFLEVLAGYYGAGEQAVDFRADPDAARRTINAWVSGCTGGRIAELLAAGALDRDTKLVLTNAISLKARWLYPFAKTMTRAAPFRLDSGQSVTAQQMYLPATTLGYTSRDGWKAVRLPYVYQASGSVSGASGLAMAVVVPGSTGLGAIERGMDEAWLRRLLSGFGLAMVQVRLPRWTFRLPVELGRLLAGLGMPTALSPAADFSGMRAGGALRIGKVAHQAFISVEEAGTEAGASTAVVMAPPALPVEVVADRPFLYVIYDVASSTPLFVGRVTDPTVVS